MEKIKVCMVANSLEINGVSTVIMNYCRNIDLNQFDVNIVVGAPVADEYVRECKNRGIKIYMLPARRKSKISYYKGLNDLLSKKKFDIFHIHGGSALIAIELLIAKMHGIKIRIAHSHNTTCLHLRMHKILFPIFKRLYTHAFACGKEAGKWLFGNRKFYIIPNGFSTEKYRYNKVIREEERKKLNIDDNKLVLGHIGRFNQQKNHKFLLEIFKEVASKNENAILLLVGTGPDYDLVMDMIKHHPYRNRIIVYGETNKPEVVYNAIDIFVFPSLFEGLPVVLLEAQISGLPCVISDVITEEVDLGNKIVRISLEKSASDWSEVICGLKEENREEFFEKYEKSILKYDIRKNVNILERLYINFVEQNNYV